MNILSKEGLFLHFDLASAAWCLTKGTYITSVTQEEASLLAREGIPVDEKTASYRDKGMIPDSKDIINQ